MPHEGSLTIVQELNSPIKLNRWLYLFDLFFILGFLAVCLFFSRFVHSSLTLPYGIFSAVVSILLTLRSPYNPQKRIFQTILFMVKKDRRCTVRFPWKRRVSMTLFKNLSRSFEKSDRLMTELIPFLSYESVSADDGYFRLKNGDILDILQIRCKDLMNILESDLNFDIFTFSKFFKTFGSDIKIIGMNFPVDIVPQKEYLDYKMEKTANTIYRERLQEKRNELKQLAEGCTYREYYLMFFSSSLEDYYNNLNLIQKSLGSHELVISIPAEKKARILFKLNNKNTSLYGSDIDLSIIQKKNEVLQEKMQKATLSMEELEAARTETQKKKKKGSPPPIAHNPYLLELLQPQGGISFRDEKVVKTGDGYEACIHVYQFPRHVSPSWLMGLVNIDGAVTTLDISTKDKLEVQRNINRSIQEQSLAVCSRQCGQ